MSYFKGILRSRDTNNRQEEEAIQTLSNRLQHATLSADRKSAVLGLKSFSRQFRESVVQYGLRALLSTLGKDTENANLVKAILETLLNLFLRTGNASVAETETSGWISSQSRVQNGKYPSPLLIEQVELDEFSNWIADEIISIDDHVSSLMSILSYHKGFQIRIYALQLLEAVVATRPERSKERILHIPLSISTIVGLLDDPNDPIRNETILLLMALVNNNFNIQKLVAFENTFSRIFEIIEEEGGIRGSILVQDCMTLLTNLLMYNASNQTLFLETDCVPKLASLIAEPIISVSGNEYSGEFGSVIPAPPIVWTEQRLQNMAILLEICRSFVDPENQHLKQNQEKLFSSGIFFSVLQLVFSPVMENPIRKVALQATGDIIANNEKLQLQFASIDVPYIDPSMPLQVQGYTEAIPAPVALLNWALLTNSVHIFEIRLAAMQCLAKFFSGNTDAKMAFLTDQIQANKNPNYYIELKQSQLEKELEGEDTETPNLENGTNDFSDAHKTPYANILTLLASFNPDTNLNPYSVWFAAITLVYLISECPDSRQKALETKVGDTEAGEEEMTAIQAISGMLVASLEHSDPRIPSGYLILLTLWIFEDFAAVDDFLSDASIIKSLVSFLSKNSAESSEIVQGMTAVLVGICYDFSTKASPFTRESLHELITKGLGPDSFALKIKQFKNNTLFKHFDGDLESEFEKDISGLPNLYFIPEYADLVKDNYYRIRKALSRGPEFEPRSRISFEVFEELEKMNGELKQELTTLTLQAEENEKSLKEQVEEKELSLKQTSKILENTKLELEEAQKIEIDLVENIERISETLESVKAEKEKYEQSSKHYISEFHKISKKSASSEDSLKQTTQKLKESDEAKQKAEDGINKMSRELFHLTKQQKESDSTINSLNSKLRKLEDSHKKALRDYQSIIDASKKSNDELKAKLAHVENQTLLSNSANNKQTQAQVLELQEKLHEMESVNENLMEKLRTAAIVVSGLRADTSELESKKEHLETELAQACEDLEACVAFLNEMEELKTTSELPGADDGSKTAEINAQSLLKEKQQVEERLAESVKLIENLQLIIEARSLESKKNNDSSSNETTILASEDEQTSSLINSSPEKPDVSTSSNASSEPSPEEVQLKSEVEVLTKDLETLRYDLQESKDALRHEKHMSQQAQDALQKEQQNLTYDYETLKNELTKLKDENNTVKAESGSTFSDNLKKRETELQIASKRIRDLERNIEVLSESASTSLASFKTSQKSLQTRIEELEKTKQKLLEEIEERREERAKMIIEFQEAYDELDSSFMDLELSSSNLEKNKGELESQLKKLQKESSAKIEKLEIESESLKKKLTETREERDTLRQEYFELEKSTNIIGSELQAKEALLQAISNKGADLAAKDKIVIEIKEKLARTIADLGDSAQKLRVLNSEKADIKKSYVETVAALEEANRNCQNLETQLAQKSEELDKSKAENKKLSMMQLNLIEAKNTNSDHVMKIEELEAKVLNLLVSLDEVNVLLDEQRKLNCQNSSAATLELTENSSKLEKSIRESQELHEKELADVRISSENEILKLKESIASLEKENTTLLVSISAQEKLQSETVLESENVAEYENRHEKTLEKLEELKYSLENCQLLLKEKQLELEESERKFLNVTSAHVRDTQQNEQEIEELRSQIVKLKIDGLEREKQIQVLADEKSVLMNSHDMLQKVTDSSISSQAQENKESEKDSLEFENLLVKLEQTLDELTRKDTELEDQAELLRASQALAEELERKLLELETSKDIQGQVKEPSFYVEKEDTYSDGSNVLSKPKALSSKIIENGDHRECFKQEESGFAKREEVEQLYRDLSLLQDERDSEQENHLTITKKLQQSIEEKDKALKYTENELKAQQEKLKSFDETFKQSQESWQQRFTEQEQAWTGKVDLANERCRENEHMISNLNEKIVELQNKLRQQELSEYPEETAKEDNTGLVEPENCETVSAETMDDLANLVLLCDHQDHQIEKYKQKLTALDIPLSSDESDTEDLL